MGQSYIHQFYQFEKELKPFEKKVGGVSCWELVRFKVLLSFMASKGNSGLLKQKKTSRLALLLNYIKYAGSRNPFLAPRGKILFFAHPRRTKVTGYYVDSYTDPLLQLLGKDEFIVLDKGFEGKHMFPMATPNLYFCDFLHLISRLVTFVYRKRLHGPDREFQAFLSDMELKLSEKLRQKIHLGHLKGLYKKYQASKITYTLLLKVIRPRKIILVGSYGNEDLIAAAKQLRIKTIELQHGAIAPGHVGYDFPYFKKDLFPDELWLFGRAWEEGINFPISSDHIKTIGFKYLDDAKANMGPESKKDQAVFISQWAIGTELSKYAIEFHKDTKIRTIYKLHPQEYRNWKDTYPWLANSGIEVVENSIPLYQLFSESKWIFGVYSTALYESLAFHCSVYILDLPGSDNFEELVRRNVVRRISSVERFDLSLLQADSSSSAASFFEESNVQNLKNLILS